MYRMLITRVSRKLMAGRSKVKDHAGAQKALTFNFDKNHPLFHTHIQRLNIKPRIVKLIGRRIPKDPGPYDLDDDFEKWCKKQKKLTDYIQAVFLPFDKNVTGMKKPEDIELKLRELRETFVGQHLLRTIHNNLTIPNITYD